MAHFFLKKVCRKIIRRWCHLLGGFQGKSMKGCRAKFPHSLICHFAESK